MVGNAYYYFASKDDLVHELYRQVQAEHAAKAAEALDDAADLTLRLGAILIRTETELVLKSRWVQPQKLLNSGFVYSQPELGRALLQIAKGTSRPDRFGTEAKPPRPASVPLEP